MWFIWFHSIFYNKIQTWNQTLKSMWFFKFFVLMVFGFGGFWFGLTVANDLVLKIFYPFQYRKAFMFHVFNTISPWNIINNFITIMKLSSHSCSGLATRLPQPKDLVKFAESSVYSPVYRGYRWSDNSPFFNFWVFLL